MAIQAIFSYLSLFIPQIVRDTHKTGGMKASSMWLK